MTGGKQQSASSFAGTSPKDVKELSSATEGCSSVVESSVWVFGYGSLLWKVNFPYQDKVVGHVKGYSRKFWQGSEVHRGIPGAPGRVVTLVEQEEECTWGIAYRVNPKDVPEVMAYLNHREGSGYSTREVFFHPNSETHAEPFTVLVYIGTISNPMFLGPASEEEIATQVVKSRGASGCNTEYVLNLAEAMRSIAPSIQDRHLFALEKLIKDKAGYSESGTFVDGQGSDCTCNLCDMILTKL